MTYRVAKRFKFSAAHRLPLVDPTDPCHRVHGHTWWAEVVLGWDELDERLMVTHFDRIRGSVGKYIEDNLDHRMLNDLMEHPTTEAIAELIWQVAYLEFGSMVERVRVEEGPNNWAEVER